MVNHVANESEANATLKHYYTGSIYRVKLIALRDLEPGEEIFIHYNLK
jgi:hypothetical protein